MLLADYLNLRYLAERPGLSAGYKALLGATVRRLVEWAGHPLTLEEIDRALLAAWGEHLLAADRPATVNDKLRMIRTLLLGAYDDGFLDRPPRRVRRVPEAMPPPEAWTVAECRRLLAHLALMPGRVGERPASAWWTSLVLAIYWTGCRIGAMLRVEASDYAPGFGLTVRKQKNGRSQWYPLPVSCCEWVERVLPENGPVWRWPHHRNTLWTHFRREVEAAGLPCPRTGRSLFHRLRRTNASYCAAADPAIAQRQLDHREWETTRRHYVDPRIAFERSAADVLPDPLDDPRDPPHPGGLRVIG